ncbi:hypothetical protein [Desulfosporosinus sp. BG]|uniref:hypothetical protein n=1 Tax=Desulfosporosinus sp. BG TaxID=1633135 RepID=UPI0008568705|nr:hypothetical protein [Desulfosporosinus sp. BG]ODA38799.1 hypothetical protein DSBG_4428 [Desulfosporosinus sp. BG]
MLMTSANLKYAGYTKRHIYTQPLNIGEAGTIQQDVQTKAMVEAIYAMITN